MVIEVKTKAQLDDFIAFQRKLYRGSAFYVPPLDRMERSFFGDNPMAENCESRLWVAMNGGSVVGRIAAIVNHNYNQTAEHTQARFTHFDCVDDEDVAHELLQKAEDWAKEMGMAEIVGPFGFTNLDKHGMLVEGFDELSCQSSNYNFPYYPALIESFGFEKQHDWVEREIKMPTQEPEKVARFAKVLKDRFQLRVLDLRKKKSMLAYAPAIFDLYNETYAKLYGVIALNEKQKQSMIKEFIPFLDPDFVSVIVDNEDQIVAFGISMFSLSKSLQKANGQLFPFGFLHLMRNRKNNKTLDLLLIGIHPDYQRKGVNAIIFSEIFKGCAKHGITHLETTQNLESNVAIQNLWSAYDSRLHKRARLYRKAIV